MKVSVIIPCYNVEEYIVECIQSLEEQSYSDIEVICIDDGSTDRTASLLKRAESSSALSISIVSQENKGAPSARNKGISLSKGEYIQFLDADDILKPNKIKNQLGVAQKYDYPELIVGSYLRTNTQNEVTKSVSYSNSDSNNVWLQLMSTDLGITSSNLFKATVFNQGLKWDESLKSSQEYHLMFQILKGGMNFAYSENQDTIVRDRASGSISLTNVPEKWTSYVDLRAQILRHRLDSGATNTDDLYQSMFVAIRILYGTILNSLESILMNTYPKVLFQKFQVQ